MEETDSIGLMKWSVLLGRHENYPNCVSALGRIHYSESSVVCRHCFWTRVTQRRFKGWSREKLSANVWVYVSDHSEFIGESFLSSLSLGWKQECFAAFDSRTWKFKSSIKARYKSRCGKGKKNPTKTSLMMRFWASLALFKIYTPRHSDLAVETACSQVTKKWETIQIGLEPVISFLKSIGNFKLLLS